MLIGTGAAPEGVITAVALKAVGGYFEGRLRPKDDKEKERALKMGADIEKIYTMDELVKNKETLFIATGVTDSALLKGIRKQGDFFIVHSIIINNKSVKFAENKVVI